MSHKCQGYEKQSRDTTAQMSIGIFPNTGIGVHRIGYESINYGDATANCGIYPSTNYFVHGILQLKPSCPIFLLATRAFPLHEEYPYRDLVATACCWPCFSSAPREPSVGQGDLYQHGGPRTCGYEGGALEKSPRVQDGFATAMENRNEDMAISAWSFTVNNGNSRHADSSPDFYHFMMIIKKQVWFTWHHHGVGFLRKAFQFCSWGKQHHHRILLLRIRHLHLGHLIRCPGNH